MVRLTFAYLVGLPALLLCVPAVLAEETDAAGQKAAEAARVFESLYGADFKHVRATRDPKDDIELAKHLLAAAKESRNQPEFLAVLCEKACDLALPFPEGQGTALEALQLLAATVPGQLPAFAARIVEIRQKQFDAAKGDDRPKAGEALIDALLSLVDAQAAAGETAAALGPCRRAAAVARAISSPRKEAVEARLSAMEQAARVVPEIEDLKKQVAQDPQNRAAREKLVRRLLVDLDDPAEAARYVEGVEDASLPKYVPAAAKPVEEAPELASLELAEWYRGMAEAATPASKAAMFRRAQAYYQRFLALHEAQDLSRIQASLAIKKIEESLAAAPPRPKAAPSAAVDEARLRQVLTTGIQRKLASSRKAGQPRTIQYKDHILETIEWPAGKGEVVHPANKIVIGWFDKANNKWYQGAVNVAGGFFLEGGEIFVEKGALRLLGSAAEPVILKDVDLSAELGQVEARSTIFVNCKFGKGGGIIYTGGYTSKWLFDNCIIAQSNFKSLGQIDYGFKFTDCTFLGCTMPKRLLRRKTPNSANPAETAVAALYQGEWNNVTRCHFVDCTAAPSFVWATKSCDFTDCKIEGTDAFASSDSLTVGLYVAPRDRPFLDKLIAGTTCPGTAPNTGRITFKNSSSPFAVSLPLETEIGGQRR